MRLSLRTQKPLEYTVCEQIPPTFTVSARYDFYAATIPFWHPDTDDAFGLAIVDRGTNTVFTLGVPHALSESMLGTAKIEDFSKVLTASEKIV